MTWNYQRPGHGPMRHKAGEVPPRPLEVGDTVVFDAGDAYRIAATTPTLLLFFDTRSVRFRKPCEGDFSDCIYATTEEI